MKVDT